MTSYWDLSEKERALLTDDKMAMLEKVELMNAGVVMPTVPDYEPVAAVEILKVKIYKLTYNNSQYNTLPIYFKDIDIAEEAAIALRGGMVLREDYKSGTRVAEALEDVSITTQDVHDEKSADQMRASLIDAKDAKNRNETKRLEYEKAMKKAEDILSSMRDDRYECRGTLRKLKKIRATLDDYVATCNGDEEVALAFLRKAYSEEEIAMMNDWSPKDE